MNYIGSKNSLLDFLDESISEVTKLDKGVFCDLFAGTGVVGLRFKQKGFSIISNDTQYYSYAINKHLIYNNTVLQFDKLSSTLPFLNGLKEEQTTQAICDYLNTIIPLKGFIYNNYTIEGTKGQEFERQYFSEFNAKKCDAIRQKIADWAINKNINENEYWFLLASLLECIDKVANTASVYGAFLKKLKRSALNEFILKPAPLFINKSDYCVYNKNANDLVNEIKADIIYIDPPYNHRQYSSNYHILETIALNDSPLIKGKTGLRDENIKNSKYCSKQKVKKEFYNLIKGINAKFIFVSYNNEGLLSKEDLKEILKIRGEYGLIEKEYKRFKADVNTNRNIGNDKTIEYLHYVKCF